MRIATGGFYHETNSFGNLLVTPEVLALPATKFPVSIHESSDNPGGGEFVLKNPIGKAPLV